MERRKVSASVGPEKKATKRSEDRKRFFKVKVKKYLKADCFLYAPLVSHPPSDLFPPAKTLDYPVPGVRTKETSKIRQKRLLERVLEYLKSDSHMYGSFFDAAITSPSAGGSVCRLEKVTMAISESITTVTEKQLPNHSASIRAGDGDVEVDYHAIGKREATKRTVYSYRPSSGSGTGTSRELRRLAT